MGLLPLLTPQHKRRTPWRTFACALLDVREEEQVDAGPRARGFNPMGLQSLILPKLTSAAAWIRPQQQISTVSWAQSSLEERHCGVWCGFRGHSPPMFRRARALCHRLWVAGWLGESPLPPFPSFVEEKASLAALLLLDNLVAIAATLGRARAPPPPQRPHRMSWGVWASCRVARSAVHALPVAGEAAELAGAALQQHPNTPSYLF